MRGLEQRMNLTVNDRERLAYITGDAETLSLIDQIELERDDAPIESDALKGTRTAGRPTPGAWRASLTLCVRLRR